MFDERYRLTRFAHHADTMNRILEYAPTEENPFVIGLPTGSTPIPVYKKLVQYVKEGEFSKRVT